MQSPQASGRVEWRHPGNLLPGTSYCTSLLSCSRVACPEVEERSACFLETQAQVPRPTGRLALKPQPRRSSVAVRAEEANVSGNPLFSGQFMGVLQQSLARQGADALTTSHGPPPEERCAEHVAPLRRSAPLPARRSHVPQGGLLTQATLSPPPSCAEDHCDMQDVAPPAAMRLACALAGSTRPWRS